MNQSSPEKFLVIGASARAVARSIDDAGYSCSAIDLFSDWDTRGICNVDQVRSLGETAGRALDYDPEYRIVFAAGMENQIGQLREMAGRFQFCGASVDSVSHCRDPFFVSDCLRQAGLPALDLRRQCPDDGNWVAKPFDSGGGQSVRRVRSGSTGKNAGGYFQRFATGLVYGASFLAHRNDARLLGVTRQLTAPHGFDEFTYQGSIGPVKVSPGVITHLNHIASELVRGCQLSGWFGVDFVLSDNTPWLLEVNPRFTASMEILEWSSGRSLFGFHLNACRGGEPADPPPFREPLLGKQYVFNRTGQILAVTREIFEELSARTLSSIETLPHSGAQYTDIPVMDSTIGPEQPICTVWATGNTHADVSDQLDGLVCFVQELFRTSKVQLPED